jgi:hypothetical protein
MHEKWLPENSADSIVAQGFPLNFRGQLEAGVIALYKRFCVSLGTNIVRLDCSLSEYKVCDY